MGRGAKWHSPASGAVVWVDLVAVKLLPAVRRMAMPELAVALTDVDLRVIRGVAAGLSNGAIAEKEGFSRSTVANRLARMYGRLGLSGATARVSLVVMALKLRLVRLV
jgi:DNA-binding NarL/FixJ family response regulator